MISMLRKLTIATLALLGFVFVSTAHAQLRVEISGVGASQIPIAIAGFANENIAPERVTDIIRADLSRSGIFKIVSTSDILSESAPIDYAGWKAKGADALVIGSVQQLADGRFDVRYRLLDNVKETQLSAFSIGTQSAMLRLTAHKIADDIYEKLTGVPGIFSTKIAYVNKVGREYRLEIADADGYNNQTALRSQEPIISPVWSPDGTKIAYVSFELQKPVIYIQNWLTKQRTLVSNFKGNNSAPAWSPDGSQLAVALSRDGLSQVYVMSAAGGGLRRITNTFGIETEPRFSPDGGTLYFTSDRSGGPQIYKSDLSSGDTRRVTFSGNYNISPRISPDGRTLVYVSRREGKFQIYSLDLSNGQEQRLSDTSRDESPSFSPNGKYILYATEYDRRGSLAIVSIDGRVKQRITTQVGDIREPTWGPFMK